MRKVLSKKAGASFLQETSNITSAVRKDGIEIIFKVQAGIYVILTLCRTDKGNGVLFANWGTYFNRLTNPQSQLPKLEKCCPILYRILVGGDPDGVYEMSMGQPEENRIHGFGLDVALPENFSLLFCLDRNMPPKITLMFDKMLKIYNELVKNPPFPAWEYGLDDVWE